MVSARALSHLSPTVPTLGSKPGSASRSVYLIDRYWLPLSLCWIRLSAGRLSYSACSRASKTNCVCCDLEARQPTILLANVSMTNAT